MNFMKTSVSELIRRLLFLVTEKRQMGEYFVRAFAYCSSLVEFNVIIDIDPNQPYTKDDSHIIQSNLCDTYKTLSGLAC